MAGVENDGKSGAKMALVKRYSGVTIKIGDCPQFRTVSHPSFASGPAHFAMSISTKVQHKLNNQMEIMGEDIYA